MDYIGYFSAILMGVSLGIIGGGGSILTVPILIYFFKFDTQLATTSSLLIVGLTALTGTVFNIFKKTISFQTGLIFALPSFLGVYLTRKLVLPSIPEIIISTNYFTLTKSNLTLIFFALLMLFSAKNMIAKKDVVKNENASINLKSGLAKGFGVGSLTGLVGAGGGFLIVPTLNLSFKISMTSAIATSLMIVSANSLFGFAISETASMPWSILLTISSLSVIGLLIGQQLTARLTETTLKRVFAVLVILIALFLLADQFIL